MYKLSSLGNMVQRLSDSAWIPFVELNADYQDYLKWFTQGNQPQAADKPFVAPKSDSDKALELVLKSISVAPEDAALKEELLAKLGEKI